MLLTILEEFPWISNILKLQPLFHLFQFAIDHTMLGVSSDRDKCTLTGQKGFSDYGGLQVHNTTVAVGFLWFRGHAILRRNTYFIFSLFWSLIELVWLGCSASNFLTFWNHKSMLFLKLFVHLKLGNWIFFPPLVQWCPLT